MDNDFDGLIEFLGVSDSLPPHIKNFKQLETQGIHEIAKVRPGIEQILTVSADAEIAETNLINTPKSLSLEGQNLTGLSIVAQGEAHYEVQYTSDDDTQFVCCANFHESFNTCIVLDENFPRDAELTVTPYVMDVHVRQMGKRKLFISALVLLNVSHTSNL